MTKILGKNQDLEFFSRTIKPRQLDLFEIFQNEVKKLSTNHKICGFEVHKRFLKSFRIRY